jgi:uncharacterized protein YlaI
MKLLPITCERLSELKDETAKDEQLKALQRIIQEGWPETRSLIPADITDFLQVRHDLTVIDGIVIKNDRLVVPRSMRNKLLKSINASHLVIEKTKQRAQSFTYWPGLSQSIKQYIQKCNACCTYQNEC